MHKKAHAMNHTTRTNRRHRLDQQRHTIAVCVAVTTLTATLNGWTPTSSAAWTIAIIAIAVGLPHGALDIVIGPQLTKPTLFFAIYLTAALGIILIWLAAPAIGVAALFTSSWYHFARGDAEHHRDLIAALAALRIRRYTAIIEIATIALIAATLHPLISFALYFALWHAPRHLLTLDINRQHWRQAGWTTIATLLTTASLWQLIQPAAPTTARVVFIGLAALTGPHLALTELLRSRPTPPINLNPTRTTHPRVKP